MKDESRPSRVCDDMRGTGRIHIAAIGRQSVQAKNPLVAWLNIAGDNALKTMALKVVHQIQLTGAGLPETAPRGQVGQ